MAEGFEPRIVVLCCNWCTYAGADLAGTSRMKYAPNVRLVRVMCSGRGDCHYINGNLKTMRRFPVLQRMLAQFGVEPARVRLEWISASEGDVFVRVVNEMVETVRGLGPLQWRVRSAAAPVVEHAG
jgi:F420-non-reducing hydrogenase iron-sulfur subunit